MSKKLYLKPTGSKLMIQKAEVATVSAGGILMPTNEGKSNEETNGTIVKVGPDFNMAGVEVGDVVVFVQYSGTTIAHNGETFTMLSQDDVVAVLTERK